MARSLSCQYFSFYLAKTLSPYTDPPITVYRDTKPRPRAMRPAVGNWIKKLVILFSGQYSDSSHSGLQGINDTHAAFIVSTRATACQRHKVTKFQPRIKYRLKSWSADPSNKLSSSQPTISRYRKTLLRVFSNAWFGVPGIRGSRPPHLSIAPTHDRPSRTPSRQPRSLRRNEVHQVF